jgi:hypothetical protein
MQVSSRFLAFVALGGVLTLAACGGSGVSPVASTAVITSDGSAATSDSGTVTTSGNGPGTGTCTHDCDGTSQGPGPGGGNGYGAGPGPGGAFCGNACTGPVGPDPADVLTVLGAALQEEYKAQMLYRSVLEDYPGTVPFAVIVESEVGHVEALQMLFARRQQTAPASAWTPGSFEPFGSIQAACAGGVDAETKDAAFYTPYLQRTDLPQDVRTVFTNLQAASLENHLPAFARCQ